MRSPFSSSGSVRKPPRMGFSEEPPRMLISRLRSSSNMSRTFSITADFPLRGKPVMPIFG